MAIEDGQILSLSTVKDRLDIGHDDHDTLLGEFIEEAEAAFEGHTRTPIIGRTFTEYHDGGGEVLFLDRSPVDEASVTVTDTEGTKDDISDDDTVDTEEYRVVEDSGMVVRTTSNGIRKEWPKGVQRFKVEYDAGHSLGEDWTSWDKARIRRSLRRLVCGWYEQIPGIREDREGPMSRVYEGLDIPNDVKAAWGKRIKV